MLSTHDKCKTASVAFVLVIRDRNSEETDAANFWDTLYPN